MSKEITGIESFKTHVRSQTMRHNPLYEEKVSEWIDHMSGSSVKLLNGAIDETPEGEIIFRGVIDHSSLEAVQVAKYQREVLTEKAIEKLMKPVELGHVPDIIVGMRGERYRENANGIYLQDPVFVIDGLQRMTAAIRLLARDVGIPHLGIKAHLNTDEAIERKRFTDLNLGQNKLSSNVTLRNMAEEFDVVDALMKLSQNKGFPLYNQISWAQNMRRGDRLTAVTYIKVAAMLHSHAGPGRASDVRSAVSGLVKIMDNVGRGALVSNVKMFYEVIDQAWGIQRVAYKGSAPFLKTTFLTEFARLLSDHAVFWDDHRLVVDRMTLKKLDSFPIADPEIIQLASSGGSTGGLLYIKMVDHINSGRKKNRLKSRRSEQDAPTTVQLAGETEADSEEA